MGEKRDAYRILVGKPEGSGSWLGHYSIGRKIVGSSPEEFDF
jgi:hypothetical protein